MKQQKRGSYQVYSPSVCMNIGSYACQHGVSSAARVFSKQLDTRVSKSTVRSIRDMYKEEVRRKRSADNSTVSVLPPRKRGRCLLLGEKMDKIVQVYLKKVREGGGAISTRIALGAAHAVLLKCDRGRLFEFGGPIQLTRHWV